MEHGISWLQEMEPKEKEEEKKQENLDVEENKRVWFSRLCMAVERRWKRGDLPGASRDLTSLFRKEGTTLIVLSFSTESSSSVSVSVSVWFAIINAKWRKWQGLNGLAFNSQEQMGICASANIFPKKKLAFFVKVGDTRGPGKSEKVAINSEEHGGLELNAMDGH